MDTSTSRFISQDSYAGSIDDPTSLHRYLYANSNPVLYSDPSGYFSYIEIAITGFIATAVLLCNTGLLNSLLLMANDVSDKLENDLTDLITDLEFDLGPDSIDGDLRGIIPNDLPTDIIPSDNVEVIPTETDYSFEIEECPIDIEPEKPYDDLPNDTVPTENEYVPTYIESKGSNVIYDKVVPKTGK